MEFTAQQVAHLIDGTVEGNGDTLLTSVDKIEEAKTRSLTFFSNPKYEHYVYTTEASAIIVDETFKPTQKVKAVLIRVKDSRGALAKLLEMYEQSQPEKVGVEQPSFISQSATVGENCYVGAFAYIGENAKIGKNVKIYPQAYVGDNVKIGDDSIIYSGVKIYKNCVIGQRCVLHASCVIGADGFGFQPDENHVFHKVAQVGNVVLHDDVEIGANTCVDRATMGSTVVAKGTKLDNLIQVAHNVEIGENTVIAAQTGIAGSTKIGKNCMFAGQVGIAGHITIADNTTSGAQAGINSAVRKEKQVLLGAPAIDYNDYMKCYVVFRKLPQLLKEFDEVKAKINK